MLVGTVKWDNVMITILLFTVLFLWYKYVILSKQVPYKIVIIENVSNPDKIINSVHPQEVLKFTKSEYSIADLSQSKGNLIVNIYKLKLGESEVFVLSPEKSLYFTTALGDTVIIDQTSEYAVIYTKDSPLFSYDNVNFTLIPGFDGLFLLLETDVLEYYTYNVILNENNITIINSKTGFEKTITGVKQVRVNLDNVYFITYIHPFNSVEQVILPTKPFSIVKINLPKNSFFVGLTTNGIDTLTFHFMNNESIQYFIGMINTYGVVHPGNNFFFLYSKYT